MILWRKKLCITTTFFSSHIFDCICLFSLFTKFTESFNKLLGVFLATICSIRFVCNPKTPCFILHYGNFFGFDSVKCFKTVTQLFCESIHQSEFPEPWFHQSRQFFTLRHIENKYIIVISFSIDLIKSLTIVL